MPSCGVGLVQYRAWAAKTVCKASCGWRLLRDDECCGRLLLCRCGRHTLRRSWRWPCSPRQPQRRMHMTTGHRQQHVRRLCANDSAPYRNPGQRHFQPRPTPVEAGAQWPDACRHASAGLRLDGSIRQDLEPHRHLRRRPAGQQVLHAHQPRYVHVDAGGMRCEVTHSGHGSHDFGALCRWLTLPRPGPCAGAPARPDHGLHHRDGLRDDKRFCPGLHGELCGSHSWLPVRDYQLRLPNHCICDTNWSFLPP
jgi:hypothetical protein